MSENEPTFEFERRFLVNDHTIVEGRDWELITQAYVFSAEGFAIRIRLTQRPNIPGSDVLDFVSARMTAKGPRFSGKREEYETDVSAIVGLGIIERSGNVIKKRRHYVVTDQTWEVDEFLGSNQGLWIAEIESTGGEALKLVPAPTWARTEVTNDPRYDNDALALFPFSAWGKPNPRDFEQD